MLTYLLLANLGTNLVIGAVIGSVLICSEVLRAAGEVTAKTALVAAALLEPPEENLPEEPDRPLPIHILVERERRQLAASAGMTAV